MSPSTVDLWPEQAVEAVHTAVVHLLQNVGLRIDSERARDVLLRVGAQELGGNRLGLTWSIVESALLTAPNDFVLRARDASRDIVVAPGSERTYVHCFGEAPFVSDARTGAVRRASVRDQILAARVAHHLRYPEILNPIFSPFDVPGELQPLISYFVIAQETDKYIGGPGVSSAAQVQGVFELASLTVDADPARGRYPVQMSFSPVSPLALGGDVAEALIEAARLGVVCVLLSCPVAGTTAPASLAGALAQQTAEVLACCVLVQAVAPGTPCIYGARLIACDPRSGHFATGGPELGYCAVGAAAMARRYGLPSDCYGLATDSKAVDAQWAMERSINALLGALGHPTFLSGAGLTQSGLAGCVDVLPLDDEILARVAWAMRPAQAGGGRLDAAAPRLGRDLKRRFPGPKETRQYMHSRLLPAEPRVSRWSRGLDGVGIAGPSGSRRGARARLRRARSCRTAGRCRPRDVWSGGGQRPSGRHPGRARPCRTARVGLGAWRRSMTDARFRTIIEPFRIKAVEPIRTTTRVQHLEALQAADYNPFRSSPTTCPISRAW